MTANNCAWPETWFYEPMISLFWNPLAIQLCVLVVLLLVIVGYLFVLWFRAFRARLVSRNLVLLLVMYGGGLGAVTAQFLAYVLHPDWVNLVLPWVSVFGAAAMAGYVRFAFEFQRPNWRQGLGGTVLNILYLGIFLSETYVAVKRLEFLQDGFVEFRDAWFDVPFTAGFLLAYVFFLERYTKAIAETRGKSRLASLGHAFRGLFQKARVIGRKATATRALIYVSLLPFVHVLLLTLRSYGWMDWAVIEPIGALLYMVMFGGFAVAYLNHAPEESSFQVKLVGASLVAVLSIASGITWLIGPVYVDAYRMPDRLVPGTSIRFDQQPDGAYSATRTVHRFEREFGEKLTELDQPITLPFDFPFFGKTHGTIYARPDGMISFGGYPIWRDVEHRFGPFPAIFVLATALRAQDASEVSNSGLFLRSGPDLVTLTFNRLISPFETKGEYSYQVRLHRDGRIELALQNLPDRYLVDMLRAYTTPIVTGIVPGWKNREVEHIRFASDLPLTGAPGAGLVEHHRLDFMTYLDQIYRPTALFLVVASLLVLLVFPRFYHNNLNLPLQAMMRGVQDIMKGNLRTSIQVEHRDELGFLAKSFNQMAKSQHELITTLEDKVAARTAEATEFAEKNARLQERQHLSRELHDAVSQKLFTANLVAGRLPEMMKSDLAHARSQVDTLQALNQEALREMRLLLQELRPEPLLNDTFGVQLQSLVNATQDRHGVTVSLLIEQDIRLPDPVQLAFFRVAQEALHNAVKHARATQIDVQFDGMAEQAMLSIRDTGAGFDADRVAPGSFGLKTMAERLASIGGSLDIETHPGDGTSITAIWYKVS